MNITSDATTPLGLGTFAFDDEGVPAQREAIVEEGVLRGFLTSRETAARIGAGGGGSMRADGWSRMPLVRMTNLHLEPGEGSLEELLADVDDGLYLETNKSWSIDDKRLNFQFGTQIAWEIKKGKLGRMLRDATYTGVTPVFWGSLDAVAGPDEWRLFGLTNCGKGQPGQEAHVSHGAAPARFRDVQVGVSRVSRRARDLAERALGAAEGDEAEALVHAERSGVARFAGSVVHQPTLIDNAVVRLRVVRDGQGRLGRDEPDRRRRPGRARAASAARPRTARSPIRTSRASRRPPSYPAVDGYDEETAALGADDQARLAAAAIERGRRLRALRLLHERRDRDRGRVVDRARARTRR